MSKIVESIFEFGGFFPMKQKSLRLGLVAGLATLLCACSHPQLVKMGDTADAVRERLGAPEAMTPMPDGTVRWTYSSQPYGQAVWWLFLDKNNKVVSREQGLQEKYFSLIKVGESTEADVWALWGKCAEEYNFPLVGEHAWMYRYQDGGSFDMAVWPQFDKTGVVRSVDVTIDPWKSRDGDFPWF